MTLFFIEAGVLPALRLALALALLMAANGLLGGLIWRALAPARVGRPADTHPDWLATVFASVGLGAAATGWLALLLAELGLFGIGQLALLWALLVVGLAGWLWRAGANARSGRSPTAPAGGLDLGGAVGRPAAAEGARSGRSLTAPAGELEQGGTVGRPAAARGGAVRRPAAAIEGRPAAAEDARSGRSLTAPAVRLELLVLTLWLITAVFLFFRPHEFVIGGADAGVYVNLGAAIAQQGGFYSRTRRWLRWTPASTRRCCAPCPKIPWRPITCCRPFS
jgi:hypothetical protein